jgi:hypothetical protein
MRSRFLLPTVALFGVATGGLHPLVSLGLARLGQGEIIVGLVTAAFYLGAFSGAISLGIGADHLTTIALTMLCGGACYPLYALGVGLMSESLEPREILAGNGLTNVAYNIGAISGPIAAAATMTLLGPQGLYVFLSGTVLIVPLLLVVTSDRGLPASGLLLELRLIRPSGSNLTLSAIPSGGKRSNFAYPWLGRWKRSRGISAMAVISMTRSGS